MKHSLLLVALTIPAAALAQQVDGSDQPAPSTAPPTSHPEPRDAVGGSSFKYSGGYVVGQTSFLYRTLRNAQRRRYAYRVHPGDQVYAVDAGGFTARWVRVARKNYLRNRPIPAGCDTTIYYLPGAALADKTGGITSFGIE